MNKAVPISIVVLLATLGLSAYAYTVYLPSMYGTAGPGTGTLNLYLTDSPGHSNATLKYLLVNVTSVTLKYSSEVSNSTSSTNSTTSASSTATSTTESTNTTSTGTSTSESDNDTGARFVFDVPAGAGTNVNITSLSGNSILLGSTNVPAGNVTGIIFNITGAKAFWTDGNSTQLKVVADGKFMVPVHFVVSSGGTSNLTVDIVPNDIHISQGNLAVLSPVIHVTVVSSHNGTTQSTETSETETESSSSSETSVSSSSTSVSSTTST